MGNGRKRNAAIFWAKPFLLLFCAAVCVAPPLFAETQAGEWPRAKALREKLVADSQTYLGCPYAKGAIGPKYFDCSGFIYFIARESARTQLPRSSDAMYRFCPKISDADLEPGDLLFFSASSSGRITHTALYLGGDKIIHAASEGPRTGVIISSRNERYWKTHYVGAGRFLPSGK